MSTILIQFSIGRIILHVVCLCADHKWQWHFNGIERELHIKRI